MGKREVDFADDIDEINEGAQVLVDATKRLERQRTHAAAATSRNNAEGEKDRNATDVEDGRTRQLPPATSTPDLEVVERKEHRTSDVGTGPTRRPRKKSKHRTPAAGPNYQ